MSWATSKPFEFPQTLLPARCSESLLHQCNFTRREVNVTSQVSCRMNSLNERPVEIFVRALTSSDDRKFPSVGLGHKIPGPVVPGVFASSRANGLLCPGVVAAHRGLRGYLDRLQYPLRLLRCESVASPAAQFAAPSIRHAPHASHSASATPVQPLPATRAHVQLLICLPQSTPEWSVPVSGGESHSQPLRDLCQCVPPPIPASVEIPPSSVQRLARLRSHSNPRAGCSPPASFPAQAHRVPGVRSTRLSLARLVAQPSNAARQQSVVSDFPACPPQLPQQSPCLESSAPPH